MASNEEIIDYVMESPDNTNPNVLRSMLGSGGGSYTLPVASADTLGGVKVGEGLSITNGVLSASGTGSGVVMCFISSPELGVWQASMTRAEVESAMSSGPVFINLGGAIGVFLKDEGYPEIYGFVLVAESTLSGGELKRYYIEFAEDGTLSVTVVEYILTPAT